jgi:hypothetical protein
MKSILSFYNCVNLSIGLLLFSQVSVAQTDLNKTAQSTMNFLLVGTSSKACAMGEAYVTLGKGSESMFYNPAGLSIFDKTFDINLNYTQWIADINYISGAAAWSLDEFGVIGTHLLTVDYGTINGTSLISSAEQSLYPLGYKDNGSVSNVGAYVFGLSYAKTITREFSMGLTVKLAGQNLGQSTFDNVTKDNDATKIVIDAGVRYQTGFQEFTFGMFIRNFSTNIKREEIEEQLPLLFSFGASINVMQVFAEEISKNNSITFALDFLHQNSYSERVNMGLEYMFLEMFSLRAGYQTNRDLASWSGGVGFNTSLSDYDIEVNYSYSSFDIFDSVSRISLNFSF